MAGDGAPSIEWALAADAAAAETRIRADIDERHANAGGCVVLCGAGQLGRYALRSLRRAGIAPRAFSDQRAEELPDGIDGVPVLTHAAAIEAFGREALYVATVYTSRGLIAHLRSLGADPVLFSHVACRFADEALPYWHLDRPTVVAAERGAIGQGGSLWADERSELEYARQVRYRLTLDPAPLAPHDPPGDLYFAPDLVRFTDREVLLDCGAYDGDTAFEFARRTSDRFRAIVAFEPDRTNAARLRCRLAATPELADRVQVVESAAYSRDGVLRFSSSGDVDSSVADEGDEVRCARIDGVDLALPPTFIKMDIEGSELEALAGARRTIAEARPILAVCLYHRYDDLWRIPALIREIAPDYRLFLRRYSDEGWETVCYGIPPERI